MRCPDQVCLGRYGFSWLISPKFIGNRIVGVSTLSIELFSKSDENCTISSR